ncbi:hypothetical protein HYT52_01640 [Candidatus Woesearchaeota archaeon]|nr:hypothetical protein [Candidatus Woesearchaeota archaeon]
MTRIMARPLSLRPKIRKNFDLPLSLYMAMEEVQNKLECSTLTEVIQSSVPIYDDYLKRLGKGERLASQDQDHRLHYLSIPGFPHGEERRRLNLELFQTTANALVRIGQERNCSGVGVLHQSVMLVDVMIAEFTKGRDVGYVSRGLLRGGRESFESVLYSFLIPVHKFR